MWPWKPRVTVATRKKLTAFLDEGSEIEGQGEIASPDTLIIGERGVVNATVRAGTLVVNGELVGNVHASERIELTGKARVFGDLESPVVVLDEGVMFEGHCRMPRPAASESTREASVVSLKRS